MSVSVSVRDREYMIWAEEQSPERMQMAFDRALRSLPECESMTVSQCLEDETFVEAFEQECREMYACDCIQVLLDRGLIKASILEDGSYGYSVV